MTSVETPAIINERLLFLSCQREKIYINITEQNLVWFDLVWSFISLVDLISLSPQLDKITK